MERKQKVVRLNEVAMGNEVKVDDGGDRDDDEISYMDKLPNEILMKILDYLDEQQLVKCRLLSSRWNEISCLLLPDRTKNKPKSQLFIKLQKCMGRNYLECTTVVKKPVDNFIDCFSPSEAEESSGHLRPFPFSHFTFQSLKYLDVTQTFFETLGPRMKTVYLNIDAKDIPDFEKLWRLLLKFAPNIQHLLISGGSLAKFKLIDPITKVNADSKAPTLNDTFLTKLKVLEIIDKIVGPCAFVKDLLDNAPNVEQVLVSGPFLKRHEFENLQVWKHLKNANLVKKLEIRSTSTSHYSPADLMKNLQLESLTANCELSSASVENDHSSTNYIHHALKSSQDTLSKLSLDSLSVASMNLCFKDISSLPNVRRLEIRYIKNPTESGNILEGLSQLCPNITDLNFDCIQGEFSNGAPILWTTFQSLKYLKLRININMKDGRDKPLAVDSAISGYSQESIKNIQTKLKADEEISVDEARRGEPQNPSILDLNDLRRLELDFLIGKRSNKSQKNENQLGNSVFIKILPQHIRENPRSISYLNL